jgi:signal peptidase I
MIDLLIVIAALLIGVFLQGWFLLFSARMVGSPRGDLRAGFLVALILFAIDQGIAVASWAGRGASIGERGTFVIGLLVIDIFVPLLILRRFFRLSFGRALVPLGAKFLSVFILVAIALGLKYAHVLQPFYMSTGGMVPTINPGDHFFVSAFMRPKRWDLVAYRNADKYHETFCMRLVGLPGEQLRFSRGSLYIDGKIVAAPAILAGKLHMYDASVQGAAVHYRDDETITLGSDEYFFVGDNIKRSADSRYYGPSKAPSIVGVNDWIFWPFNHFKILR